MLRSAGPTAVTAADAVTLAPLLDANQSFTPLTGDTIALTSSNLDGLCFVNPAGILAVLNITLPSDGSTRVNQERDIYITKAITALNITGATSILNNITTSIANSWITVKKVAPNTWGVRVS